MKKIVFFATAWSSESGGINSINIDLCVALAKGANEIYVVVPKAERSEVEHAQSRQVNLIIIDSEFSSYNKKINLVREKLGLSDFSEISWVGHDAVTGGAAILSRKLLGGQSIAIHHMDYSNYYYLKSSEVKDKISIQKTILRAADIVIAVGPRLFHSAKHIREVSRETYHMVPGAPEYKKPRAGFDYRVGVSGRLGVDEDPVKNISAAIGAAKRVLASVEGGRGCINLIGSLTKEGWTQLSKSNNTVAINHYSYIKNRDEYFEHLTDCDILLMPSVKEGFGLVAWEACCLGIPVVVSKSSGVYEFIKSLGFADHVVGVEISGIFAVDETEISKMISLCFDQYEKFKLLAEKLAAKLSVYTWESSAEQFASLVGSQIPTEKVAYHETVCPSVKTKPLENVPMSPSPELIKTRSKGLSLDRDMQTGNFERFEDLLSINFKKRELLVPKSQTTDYSKGRKVKFEIWKVYSPQPSYFLYINPGSNIAQTIRLFAKIVSENNLLIREIYVLRRDSGDANYMSKMFSDNDLKMRLNEYSLKEYIWEFCIDESFKTSANADVPSNYIDQSLEIEVNSTVTTEPSRAYLLSKLLGKPECSAYLVVATGGMGKTWLCRSLVNEISLQYKDKLVVLIQAETLRDYFYEVGFAHIHVKSVFDLYEIHQKSIKAKHSYDRSTFELAVISGNILVIIDGLDELATVLQERFDIVAFLSSVRDLSLSLQSSQMLLTTRDNLLVGTSQTEEFGLKKHNLLGFSPADWMRYAGKRFNNHPAKSELTQKLNKVLSESNLAGPEGRVIPFLVDVVSNILEEQEKDRSVIDFELSTDDTPYPSNNELIDRVIYSIFRREIRRQNIDITIDQLVALLSEIVSDNGEQFHPDVLKHQLDLYYESRSTELFNKITLNPLLLHHHDALRLRYGFLQSHFRSLLIIDSLQKTSLTQEALSALAKSNADESPEVAYVRKFFSAKVEQLESLCIPYFSGMRKIVQTSDEIKNIELARRAISGLLKIYSATRSFSGQKLTEKIVEFLPSHANNGRAIDGLCIYGDFPPLDFSDITVFHAKFLDYKNLARCKFRGSKFLYCNFESCATENHMSDSIGLAEFDDSCSLGDISKVIDTAKSKESLSQKTLESDCLIFLRSFFARGSRYDPKRSWIKFSTRIPGLKANAFDKLVPEYFAIKTKKSDETYYSVSDDFLNSVRNFLDNNYKDDKFRKFLKRISQ